MTVTLCQTQMNARCTPCVCESFARSDASPAASAFESAAAHTCASAHSMCASSPFKSSRFKGTRLRVSLPPEEAGIHQVPVVQARQQPDREDEQRDDLVPSRLGLPALRREEQKEEPAHDSDGAER